MKSDHNKEFGEGRVWEKGFDGHERAQLKRMAAMPFSKKLEWLEEAHYLVLHLEAARKKKKGPTIRIYTSGQEYPLLGLQNMEWIYSFAPKRTPLPLRSDCKGVLGFLTGPKKKAQQPIDQTDVEK